MSLHIKVATAISAYETLRTTEPFCRWGLPPADDLEFRIMVTRTCMGWFRGKGTAAHHEIGLSTKRIGSLATLDRVLAHEMIHLKQETARTTTPKTEHNAEFYRLSALVAKHHCFDPKEL